MSFDLGIVGESFTNPDGTSRQDIIQQCDKGDEVLLVAEPDNPVDKDAVAVYLAKGYKQIGYIPKEDTELISETINSGKKIKARISFIDEAIHEGKRTGLYGVRIEINIERKDPVISKPQLPAKAPYSCPHCEKELGEIAAFRGICPFCHKVFEAQPLDAPSNNASPKTPKDALAGILDKWCSLSFFKRLTIIVIGFFGFLVLITISPKQKSATTPPPMVTAPVVVPPKTDWQKFSESVEKGSQEIKKQQLGYAAFKSELIVNAKAFVRQNAFYPESAEFPSEPSEYEVRDAGNGYWEVSSYARSKNALGGYVINRFTVLLQRRGSEWFGKVNFQN